MTSETPHNTAGATPPVTDPVPTTAPIAPVELFSSPRVVRSAMPLLELIKYSLRLHAANSIFGRGRIAHARKSGPGRRHRGVVNWPGDKLHRRWYGRTQASQLEINAKLAAEEAARS